MPKRPKYRQEVRIYWYDIEGSGGWGKGAKEPPLCVTVGYVIEAPSKRQKVRSWRIASSLCEVGFGDASIIPEGVVKKVKILGRMRVRYRK